MSTDPEEQREAIKKIEKESFAIGEKVCPISTLWFQKWKQQVNYNNSIEPTPTKMGPIDNSKIISDGKLKQNLVENYDYCLIHKESYDLLQKWYSGGPTVELDVISNSKGRPAVVTKFIILKINYKKEEKPLEVHKYMKISEIHQKAREMFAIPETTATRLLDFFSQIVGFEFKDDKYLDNYPIISNEQILLDYKIDPQTDKLEEPSKSSSENTEKDKKEEDDQKQFKKEDAQKQVKKDEINEETLWYSYSLKKQNKTNSNLNTITVFSPSTSRNYIGISGFQNLGNTCFFNSGTQCLMHTFPLVSKFVLNDDWQFDLNLTNKIGMKGELAKTFASLAKEVWNGGYQTIAPSNLKYVIGRFRDTFAGYDQQDSHELIYAMLDGIHEDLNRCRKKPSVEPVEGDGTDDDEKAVEAWKRYKLINDSIVVDIFDGLFRSKLLCPKCNSTTVVFDPYRSIPLPIEKPHTKKLKVVFVPFEFAEERKNLKIEIPSAPCKNFNRIASEQISKIIGRKVVVKLGAQLYKGYPLQWGIKNICVSTATVFAFEMPNYYIEKVEQEKKQEEQNKDRHEVTDKDKNEQKKDQQEVTDIEMNGENKEKKVTDEEKSSVKKPIFMTCSIDVKAKLNQAGIVNVTTKIGYPFLVDVSDLPDDFDESDGKLQFEQRVAERLSSLWPAQKSADEGSSKKGEEATPIDKLFRSKMEISLPQGFAFSGPTEKLLSTFKSTSSYYFYKQSAAKEKIKTPSKASQTFVSSLAIIYLNEDSNFSAASLLKNIQLDPEKKKKESDALTLSKCFEFFSLPDVLDENNQWYCPKCKQFVCAEKKLDIWALPQILIIQLKRFYGSGWSAKKLDYLVDFPEILDMKKYVIGPQKNEEEIKYRLYAVSNQFGNLGFGHYTAYARVRDPKEPDADKGWYNFDDSSVSKASEANAHSAAAYVLFYERIK
ncbi:hypothetical protein M9Y10_015413 [Tritrichomonas musculus]|uniref:ubiquitinyl hydrolase 1 n=1 Tax=Tritrichomonas musculus TaxID=1915356 RepID=A0ABR2L2B5_9EUKA